MRIVRFIQLLGMLLVVSVFGCANRSACNPYPGYSYPYQAYPYGYAGQPGQPGQPIQPSPMVGTVPPGGVATAPGALPTYPIPGAAGYPQTGAPTIPPNYGYPQPIIGR